MKHPENPIKKVEWYSDHHNNLTDDVSLVEEKASTEQDCHQKADKKLVQANSKITELEAKLVELQRELTVLQKQDKRTLIVQDISYSLKVWFTTFFSAVFKYYFRIKVTIISKTI